MNTSYRPKPRLSDCHLLSNPLDELGYAFQLLFTHWLVTEVQPIDITVWGESGSTTHYATYDLSTGKFYVRPAGHVLNLDEIVLGVQHITLFEAINEDGECNPEMLPEEWAEDDLLFYLSDVIQYWDSVSCLQEQLIGSMRLLSPEEKTRTVNLIIDKANNLLADFESGSLTDMINRTMKEARGERVGTKIVGGIN